MAAQPQMVDALGEHSRQEQCVVANVLAHLTLAIERRSGTIDRIGFEQHFANIGKLVIGGIMNLEELIRSEEHTSELQSQSNLVCRLLLEKKKTTVVSLITAMYRNISPKIEEAFLCETSSRRILRAMHARSASTC